MKIKEGLKLQGKLVEIPDCSRYDLPQFFLDMGFKVGAEIGVWQGEFTEKFAKVGLKMYAIDPWAELKDYNSGHPGFQNSQNKCYEITKKALAPYNCTIIRKTSMDALVDIPDESLDFVYIDGNHWFRYVAEDICEWTKKVKKGGFVCGHDYFYTNADKCLNACHVRYIVDAYVACFNIKHSYVLGLKNSNTRDQWRSWMFIKE